MPRRLAPRSSDYVVLHVIGVPFIASPQRTIAGMGPVSWPAAFCKPFRHSPGPVYILEPLGTRRPRERAVWELGRWRILRARASHPAPAAPTSLRGRHPAQRMSLDVQGRFGAARNAKAPVRTAARFSSGRSAGPRRCARQAGQFRRPRVQPGIRVTSLSRPRGGRWARPHRLHETPHRP